MVKKKQHSREAVIEAINRLIVENGLPPTVEELKQALKLGSNRTVLRYLKWLEDEGDIERWSGARGIKLTRPLGGSDEMRRVPLVGEATAGALMLAEENREGWVQLPTEMLAQKSAKYFLLRVKGDSMNKAPVGDEPIENGDLVLVEQRATANSGDIVVALVDGEATIKRLVKGSGYWILKPESTKKKYSPIILKEDFQVQGIITKVLKKGAFLLNDN